MDNFDKFRSSLASSKILSGPDRVVYAAHKETNKYLYRLKIRPKDHSWERLSYGQLLRIVEDGLYGEMILLVYSMALVIVEGRNLQSVTDAIDNHTCEFIQAFDERRWPEPTDEKAPFISSISIHVESHGEQVRSAQWMREGLDKKHKDLKA